MIEDQNLGIELSAELINKEGDKEKIQNLINAIDNAPEYVEISVGINGDYNNGNKLRINVLEMILKNRLNSLKKKEESIAKYANIMLEKTEDSLVKIKNFLNTIYNRITNDGLTINNFKYGTTLEETINNLSHAWTDFSNETKREIAVNIAGRFYVIEFYTLMEALGEKDKN